MLEHRIVPHLRAADLELAAALDRAQGRREADLYVAVWQRLSGSARELLAYRALVALAGAPDERMAA